MTAALSNPHDAIEQMKKAKGGSDGGGLLVSSLGSPKHATQLRGAPQTSVPTAAAGTPGRQGRKGGASEGCGVVPARSSSSSANSSLAPRPSPSRSLQEKRKTPNKSRGWGDKEAAGEGRPEQCGGEPSQTPVEHAEGRPGRLPRKSPPSSGPGDGGPQAPPPGRRHRDAERHRRAGRRGPDRSGASA